ncbi:MAG: acyltransferase family protein [Chloroflexi bacterium]|nr:acyltransferase family protein [Chloroflexota bacterium]
MLTLQPSPPLAVQVTPSAGRDTPTAPRLIAFDRVRVLLAVLVVAHHAGQPYGPTGGEWPLFSAERAAILGPFFAVNAAFFMGLFFFIAGYLMPGAVDRHGPTRFLRERLLRLGVPLLAFALVVFPLIVTAVGGGSPAAWLSDPAAYARTVQSGHLWFLGHLLIYAAIYAAWRGLRSRRPTVDGAGDWVPGHRALLGLVVALALVTFAVRLGWAIDQWVTLPGNLTRFEPAHLPQYLILFVLGVLAYRHDWFRRLPASIGLTWLGLGLAAGAAFYLLGPLNVLGLRVPTAGGGLGVGSLVWSLWEALICIGLSVGLLTLFRDHWTRAGRLLPVLAANTYGVYVIHLLLIITLQFAIADLAWPPLAKFGLVTLVGVPLCFLVSAALRLLPPVRRVL